MNKLIKNYYKEASFLGLSPYEFDNHISRYDVFDMKNGHISRVNKHKYMFAAKHVLDTIKGMSNDK